MILVDVNLLLYAANPHYAEHGVARAWWESQLNGTEPVGLTWQTLSSFIRIGTNPRIFRQPLARDIALQFVDEWVALPVVRVLEPASQHWQTFRKLILDVRPDPNLVTDAYLAAIAINHGCELVSADEDFSVFPGLRWRNPLVQPSTALET